MLRGDTRIGNENIRFKNQRIAKQCVDELNETVFPVYEQHIDRDNKPLSTQFPNSIMNEFKQIINTYAER